MKQNGGYIMVDATGLNLASYSAQTITGIWKKAVKAIAQKKPIICSGCTYGTAPVSPVTCFGWYIASDEIVIVGATLHVHIKDTDSVTVLDVATS